MANIQDVLARIKSGLSNPVGKTIAGLGGAVAAGHFGGAEGISALGGAVDRLRQDRDLTKLNKVKQSLADYKLMNTPAVEEKLSSSDWRLKNTRAVEPDEIVAGKPRTVSRGFGGSRSGPKMPKIKPQVLTGPDSLMVEDEDQLQKNIEAIQSRGAKAGADIATRLGLDNVGLDALKPYRKELSAELEALGLDNEQIDAAWREIHERAEPGAYAKFESMRDKQSTPLQSEARSMVEDLFNPEKIYKESAALNAAFAGGTAGSVFGPFGTVAGALGGGAMGYAGADWLASNEGIAMVADMAGRAKQYLSDLMGGNSNSGTNEYKPKVMLPDESGINDPIFHSMTLYDEPGVAVHETGISLFNDEDYKRRQNMMRGSNQGPYRQQMSR